VYGQRLKQSGMRWQKAGAQTILTLRVMLLSGVWSEVYERTLQGDSARPSARGAAQGLQGPPRHGG
jgi:hypothetical protein